HVPSLSARGGAEVVHKLFEPLGWHVSTAPIPLDPQFPQWGDSRYVDLRLTGTHRAVDALRHLYVLLPALDGAQHSSDAQAVLAGLRAAGARRVLDLGCGPGALLRVLEKDRSFTEIVGVDVSASALDVAEKRLKDTTRVTLRQSALTYADPALAGYDAAVLM